MGTFEGPAANGQVITIQSTESVTGKYVVVQLWKQSGVLNLLEVKVLCGTAPAGTSGKERYLQQDAIFGNFCTLYVL